jgi:hypothetical protein
MAGIAMKREWERQVLCHEMLERGNDDGRRE